MTVDLRRQEAAEQGCQFACPREHRIGARVRRYSCGICASTLTYVMRNSGGIFHSVPDLTTAIEAFLAAHNTDPKPFLWTTSIDAILAKIGRRKAILETVH